MTARRVLLVLLGILLLSTLVAALVPRHDRTATHDRSTTTTRSTTDRASSRGHLLDATIDADSRRLQVVRAREGDELVLTVNSPGFGQVEIPAFGEIDSVSRDDPARFDFLVDRRGRFEIAFSERDRPAGVIVVR